MTLAPGTRLGSYEIVSALGAGGMGEVFRARDTRLKREVALKIRPPAVAKHPGFTTRGAHIHGYDCLRMGGGS